MGAFKLDYGDYFYCTKKCNKSNHLGNVLTLFTDKKIPVGTGSTVSYYKADLVSSMDYSPFGAPLKGRTFNGSGSRYGFGGHEKNNELEGAGNSYDMGDRWLDVRLGRTPKLDAKATKYPDMSPYSFAANNPIMFVDKDGKDVIAYDATSQSLVIKTLNYALGEKHGFEFENNQLIHKGNVPKDLTPQQNLMFKYFNDVLVKSNTQTFVNTNQELSRLGGGASKDGCITISSNTSRSYDNNGLINIKKPDENDILITKNVMLNGINVDTEEGSQNFSAQHALLHEFAHSMENIIMNEMGGKFNGVDFNKMEKSQRSDWAISFTNTLLATMKEQPLETGKGQHENEVAPPKDDVKPLTK